VAFDEHRHTVETESGTISYYDLGADDGRTVLFVHGIGTNALLWQGVIEQLSAEHRCVALDLPLHGHSAAATDQDFSLPGLAKVVADFAAALNLTAVDLVANDTGGAIAQVFAARHANLLASFTLTNCDTHDNLPPEAFKPIVAAAAAGQFAPTGPPLVANPAMGRKAAFGTGYQSSELPSDELVRSFLDPVMGTLDRAREFERLLVSLKVEDLLAAEPALRELTVPTLLVWGTADRFFELKWAYWLLDTIPGAKDVVEVAGGKLFFPNERPDELVAALRSFWA
jgi:pimeloyl-ACP methyl ester carboxylesterase